MIRKQARQRRDYLYRKALILKEAETTEKRAQLRSALASGKPIDPEIAKNKALRKDYQYDESRPDRTVDEEMDLDDEYSQLSGISEPRLLVTTSRDPSSRLSAFSKEIRLLFPTSVRLNRGNLILPDIVQSSKSNGLTDIVLLHEHRGVPTAMTYALYIESKKSHQLTNLSNSISHLPHGPTLSMSLHNVVLRADIPGSIRGSVSEAFPRLIFEGFKSRLGQRIVKILKHLFPPLDPPTTKAKVGSRVVTFVNNEDSIEVRHHVFVRTSYDSVELAEVGPRMTMRPFEIRGGTLENKDGDVEWHLTQYTRTGRKKEYL
ncbi:brix domain-containing protein [Colletotrichum abscissum]|uniref:U3 small nucleolar ribonucleoprotein protein IMP4 n=1 Tax=Colletotrichum costaricense TaxID=1209916 RepID=A0AAJ0E3U3_9PEZI|nr:brix domain-containing protein [Colletotrichum costaricense]XP_060398419.1 brix domain-containing protein [Colletotrichum abscissum]KAI3542492.1 brix domain-containing protein [Colletotrichum filicis]KAK1496044.1 brix domain-containing protein [Colletotrichum abscissum]KAK1530835.1 brix domain-containing protein [Colletotrichum costaricense]